jgi:hypothetical protein
MDQGRQATNRRREGLLPHQRVPVVLDFAIWAILVCSRTVDRRLDK